MRPFTSNDRMERYAAFWKTRPFVSFSIHFFFLVAFLLKLLIGHSPWYVEFRGERHFLLWDESIPAGSELQRELLNRQYDWDQIAFDRKLDPMFRISGSPYFPDQAWRPPLSADNERFHWLGTWDLGRDMLVSLVFGMQKSLVIALVSILLGLLWGLPAGIMASFRGFRQIKTSIWSMLLGFTAAVMIIYSLMTGAEIRHFTLLWVCLPVVVFILFMARKWSGNGPQIRLDADFWFMRWLEFSKSVPLILLVLLILQLSFRPGMWTLALIMAFFLGMSFAKYARFATRALCKENYMSSLDALGYPDRLIFLQYLLPSVLRGTAPLIALSVAHVVLIESSLSFLGLGLPVEEISLGGIMQSARNYPYAWWSVLFPGLSIFWIIYCFQSLDDYESALI